MRRCLSAYITISWKVSAAHIEYNQLDDARGHNSWLSYYSYSTGANVQRLCWRREPYGINRSILLQEHPISPYTAHLHARAYTSDECRQSTMPMISNLCIRFVFCIAFNIIIAKYLPDAFFTHRFIILAASRRRRHPTRSVVGRDCGGHIPVSAIRIISELICN